jgi:acyl-CoA dehydrogenase
MSEHEDTLAGAATDIFHDYCTSDRLAAHEGALDTGLWEVLRDTGLTRVGLPEEAGGSGGSLADAAVVLRLAGAYSAQVPLAEALIGGWLLASAGLPLPDGILTLGLGALSASRADGRWRVTGTLPRVPYAAGSDAIAGIAAGPNGPVVFAAPRRDLDVRSGINLAGEPRDNVTLNVRVATAAAVTDAPTLHDDLHSYARLGRVLMIAGAARSTLDATVRYASERHQFGRPIAAFQAVQQQIAYAAGETAAARGAADSAVNACAHGLSAATAQLACTAAKARAGLAAGAVASVAHQVHGAIGITHEHTLRFRTTRLWSWRDEWASDTDCMREFTAAAVAAGEAGLWPLLTAL